MDPANLAIDAALNRDWNKAILLNQQLIKSNPADTEALNRLARAYLEINQHDKAVSIYKKVLHLDKYNTIASKGMELARNSHTNLKSTRQINTPIPIFLEEPGVTKTITLIRLGDQKTISALYPGDPVSMQAHEHSISIVNSDNQYIGRLPDDLSSRLRPFIKSGNTYQSWIRSVDLAPGNENVKVFIKEIFRAAKFRNTPSFPSTEKLTYAAFTPPELVHGSYRINVSTPEEDTEEFEKTQAAESTDLETDTDSRPGYDDN